MVDGIETWLVLGLPCLVALVALATPLVRSADQPTRATTRDRLSFLVAVAVVPAVFVGGLGALAVLVVGNLTLGRAEFVPFSRYKMFSTIPAQQSVVFLLNDAGDRVSAASFSTVHNQDLTKTFLNGRRGYKQHHPEWDDAALDDAAASLLETALTSARKPDAKVPAGTAIMLAVLSCGADGPVAEERRLRLIEGTP